MFTQYLDLFYLLRRPEPLDALPWMNPFINAFMIELLFWTAVFLMSLLFFFWRPLWFSSLETTFKLFARRKTASLILIGCLSLGLRLAALPWIQIPLPVVHDEYSMILQAQTFNAGRITNPPHPMWVHLETYHVNMWPTYQSMYPPGQAIFLALGQRLAGNPWFGVWLSVALMCAAICWMLQGWMPPHWALLGGLFCVMRFSIFGTWINSYNGGAVAAIGGALLFGALVRIFHRIHITKSALLFSLGLVLLANTRPFEGFALSIVPMLGLLAWLWKERTRRPALVRNVVTCAMLVLMPAFAAMLYYNWRGTGHPLMMPYMLNQKVYHITKPLIWQSRYPLPQYNHVMMEKFYTEHELPDYEASRTTDGLIYLTQGKMKGYYGYFVWPFLLAMVPTCWFAAKSRRWRLPVLTVFTFLFALLIETWRPHGQYAAPVTCLVVALLLLVVRLARTIRFRGIGLAFSRAIVVTLVLGIAVITSVEFINPWHLSNHAPVTPTEIDRARLAATLAQMPGKHLVVVFRHYYSQPGYDWIYNEPDIDGSKVVWARDMGAANNQELLKYFSDRRIWFVDQDEDKRLVPYETPNGISPQLSLLLGQEYINAK